MPRYDSHVVLVDRVNLKPIGQQADSDQPWSEIAVFHASHILPVAVLQMSDV
jgi:hypothetical protein